MPVLKVGPGRALVGGGGTYNDLVMGTQPIAYWPQSESSGLTAYCLTNPAMNGTYTGVTLANDLTGPFGTPAPYFDGLNDYCDIGNATFRAAFQAAAEAGEFSVMSWGKVNAGAVWTDGAERNLVRVLVDANNFIYQRKAVGNNRMEHDYNGAGTFDRVANTPYSNTAWFCTITTVSDSADEMKGYWDAAQVGGTQAGIGLWAGLPNAGQTVIGAATVVPGSVWHGWIGPVAVWPYVLPQAVVSTVSLA